MAIETPSWFNESVYMANKLKQLQASEPNANWTEASMNQAFTESGYGAGNAYQHFLDHGQAEDISPVAEFNASEYYTAKAIDFFNLAAGTMPTAAQYDEIVKIIHDVYPQGGAWEHYQRHGMEEGTNPSNGFDASGYMDTKLALMVAGDPTYTMDQLVAAFEAAGYTPMSHYLMHKGSQGEVATDAKFTVPTGEQVTPPADPGVPGGEFRLTADQDAITGTAANDTFIANIFDNQNTLQSGDYINGGAGTDTLKADLGTSNNFVITPETKDVEVVKFRVEADINDEITTPGDNNIGHAHIDAERMEGVKEFWSSNSRADLVIEDIRINSNQITIGMENTDAGDVDYSVFFDPQHLTAKDAVATGSVLSLELMDTRSAVDGKDPLLNSPYSGFVFSLDGKLITVKSPAIDAATTYADLFKAIEAAVKATPGLENFTVQFGPDFTAKDTVSGDTAIGQTIQLVNNGAGTISTDVAGTGWVSDSPVPPSSGLHTDMSPDAPVGDHPLIQTNVVLDNVGRVNWNPNNDPANNDYGSEAGNLLIGSMAERGGVERFDVEVKSGSWLNSMSSTNDTLENVTVKEGSKGNLYIGGNGDDSMTSWTDAPIYLETGGLTNVRTFDASKLGDDGAGRNDVKLNATIDDGAFAKYLNDIDTDTQPNPGDDDLHNADFVYTTGSGDDALNIGVNQFVAADNDFTMNINTGAGDDDVRFSFTDDKAGIADDATVNVAGNGNWLTNQQNNKNVTINTGEGDDTISTYGGGSVNIVAGAGNDAIYVGQDGTDRNAAPGTAPLNKAVFVLGAHDAAAGDLTVKYDPKYGWVANDNILSGEGTSYAINNVKANATMTVTVTFEGVEKQITIALTGDADGNATITDLRINQAIKEAINNDDTLSKLLVAKDGPYHSLVIESLIDGAMDADSLNIGFSFGKAADGTPLASWTDPAKAPVYTDEFAHTTAGGADVTITGKDSVVESDNVINGGLGNDVIVLGTNLISNDVVTIDGAFGDDVVLNFGTNKVAGIDKLNFNSLLGYADGAQVDKAADFSHHAASATDTILDKGIVVLKNLADTGKPSMTTVEGLKAALADDGQYAGIDAQTTTNGKYVFMVYDADSDRYYVFTATSTAGANAFNDLTLLGSVELGGVTADMLSADNFGNTADNTAHNSVFTFVANGGLVNGTDGDDTFIGSVAGLTGTTLDGKNSTDTLSLTTAMDNTAALGDGGAGGTLNNIEKVQLADVANVVKIATGINADNSNGSATLEFIGGMGNDTFEFTNVNATQKINAGDGVDTLKVVGDGLDFSTAVAIPAIRAGAEGASLIGGFEKIVLGSAVTTATFRADQISGIAIAAENTAAAVVTVNALAAGGTIDLTDATKGTAGLTFKVVGGVGNDVLDIKSSMLATADGFTGGTGNDTLNVTADAAISWAGLVTANTHPVSGVEVLNFSDKATDAFDVDVTTGAVNAATTINGAGLLGTGTFEVDGTNATAALTITGSAKGADVLIGGTVADTITAGGGGATITGGAGNDVITLGAGTDTVVLKGIVAAANGDTINGFAAADKISLGTDETTFDTNVAFQDVPTNTAAKVTFDTSASNILEFSTAFSGTTLAGVNDGTALLALVSGGIDVKADTNEGYIVAYQGGNAYLYHAVEGSDGDVVLAAADITLVGVFNGVAAGTLDTANFTLTA